MVTSGYIPDEGDIVWINLDPQAGHEQKGRRPALVITPKEYNKIGLMIACPITNQIKGYPFEINLNGYNVITTGAILVDHLKSVDWHERKAMFKEKTNTELIKQVKKYLWLLIGKDD